MIKNRHSQLVQPKSCDIYTLICCIQCGYSLNINISIYHGKTSANILPVNNQSIELCRFITYWTHPRWLFLVHLEICCSIETLQVRTGACSTWCTHPHLAQLQHAIRTQFCDCKNATGHQDQHRESETVTLKTKTKSA